MRLVSPRHCSPFRQRDANGLDLLGRLVVSLYLLSPWCVPAWAAPSPASQPAGGTTYYVDGSAAGASDAGAGTAAAPWKTISRAAGAKELQPGDTVLIRSGVYRESVDIRVSGQEGRPITFAAAPDARVVIKGSEIVKGKWTKLPQRDVWKIALGEEFFTDARFQGGYRDKARRWVSQVFLEDELPLQRIGADPVYPNREYDQLTIIGKGKDDLLPQSFCYDPAEGALYVKIGGEPGWFVIEVGVRAFALTATGVHDVVIRGLEMRHNRQPGGQWPLVAIGNCRRVVVEDCQVRWADFNGLSLGRSQDCVIRRCDLSWCGCTGLALGETTDCVVEDCTLLFNNYRRFCGAWGVAAGMKNIPGNVRTTVRRCEAAFTTQGEGIWFDTANSDIRILDNVCHHNEQCGIFFEINPGGGIIAGNLVYANRGRGIYVSGSQNTWVVHNTLAENASGIVAMTRGKGEPARNTRVRNNLLIRNYVVGATVTRDSDLTLEMPTDAPARTQMGSDSDYNVFADNSWTPFLRHNWNDNNTLDQWRNRFGQDLHSRQTAVRYRRAATRFKLLTREGLDAAGPLPDEVKKIWQPRQPAQVGCDLTQWPPP